MMAAGEQSQERFFSEKEKTCSTFIRGDGAKIKKYIKELRGKEGRRGGRKERKKHVEKDGV